MHHPVDSVVGLLDAAKVARMLSLVEMAVI